MAPFDIAYKWMDLDYEPRKQGLQDNEARSKEGDRHLEIDADAVESSLPSMSTSIEVQQEKSNKTHKYMNEKEL